MEKEKEKKRERDGERGRESIVTPICFSFLFKERR
jgi:hypothetical protein